MRNSFKKIAVLSLAISCSVWAVPSASAKNLKVRKIIRAYSALENEEFSQARLAVSSLLKDPIYQDWALGISASALRGEALAAYTAGKFKEVKGLLDQSVNFETQIEINFPTSPFARTALRDIAQAELLAADSAWALKNWSGAIAAASSAFERLLEHGGLNQLTPSTVAHFAESCRKQRNETCEAWLTKLFLTSASKSEEAHIILKFFPSLVDLGRPPKFAHATQPYKAPDLDVTAFDSAMQLYWKSDFKSAASSFQKFHDDFPKSNYRFRVRYLLGEALNRSGKGDESKKVLQELVKDAPLTYYGLLAAFSLGQTPEEQISTQAPQSVNHDPFELPSEAFKLKRVTAFLSEGAPELAALELKDLKPRDGLSNGFLYYLATLGAQAKNYSFAFQILSELGQRSAPELTSSEVLKIIFPLVHTDLVEKYSTLYKMDPILILSLIKQESAFDEKIFSSVGAQGLMQLMPATAAEILGELEKDDLLDAEKNIQAGTKYFAKLMDRFHGNAILALAGYNAGPGAVDRWLKDSPNKADGSQFIETIPYKETREYVGSILRNYFWYSKKLKAEQKPLSYFWVNP